MYWNILYKDIAELIDKSIKEPQYSYVYLLELVNKFIDVKSDNDGSLISRTFLYKIWKIYVEAYDRDAHMFFIPQFVDDVNTFTINNYGDLNSFVNSIDWDSNGIPENWISLSADCGYDLILE